MFKLLHTVTSVTSAFIENTLCFQWDEHANFFDNAA